MTDSKKYPMALENPEDNVVLINRDIINRAVNASRESPRKRIILPFHKADSDNLHRMLNVLQPGSYVQPHRHIDPPKAESIIVLSGELICVEFDNTGEIKAVNRLSADSFNIGIDIEPGVYHTIFASREDTVLFEVKPGPYKRSSDKDFASWAPAEGSDNSVEYLENLYRLSGSDH
jgi:cupin fold WbuC family metalloprotein